MTNPVQTRNRPEINGGRRVAPRLPPGWCAGRGPQEGFGSAVSARGGIRTHTRPRLRRLRLPVAPPGLRVVRRPPERCFPSQRPTDSAALPRRQHTTLLKPCDGHSHTPQQSMIRQPLRVVSPDRPTSSVMFPWHVPAPRPRPEGSAVTKPPLSRPLTQEGIWSMHDRLPSGHEMRTPTRVHGAGVRSRANRIVRRMGGSGGVHSQPSAVRQNLRRLVSGLVTVEPRHDRVTAPNRPFHQVGRYPRLCPEPDLNRYAREGQRGLSSPCLHSTIRAGQGLRIEVPSLSGPIPRTADERTDVVLFY